MIVCSVCDKMVRGSKFYTEPTGKIICDNCEQTGEQIFSFVDFITKIILKIFHFSKFRSSMYQMQKPIFIELFEKNIPT